MNYFVYMVRCRDGSYYVGVTNNVERRIGDHNAGSDPRAYTHDRRPVTLVYSTDFRNIDDAIRFEKQLKGWSRAKKCALIAGNWPEIVRLSNRGQSSTSSD